MIYDNKAHRMSGVTADSIIQLKGANRPFPLEWVLGGALGLIVVALLLIVVLRGSSKKAPAQKPAPVVAGYTPAPPQPIVAANPYAQAPAPAAAPAANPEFMYGPGAAAQAPKPAPIAAAQRAILHGSAGTFTVVRGTNRAWGAMPPAVKLSWPNHA